MSLEQCSSQTDLSFWGGSVHWIMVSYMTPAGGIYKCYEWVHSKGCSWSRKSFRSNKVAWQGSYLPKSWGCICGQDYWAWGLKCVKPQKFLCFFFLLLIMKAGGEFSSWHLWAVSIPPGFMTSSLFWCLNGDNNFCSHLKWMSWKLISIFPTFTLLSKAICFPHEQLILEIYVQNEMLCVLSLAFCFSLQRIYEL